MNIEQLTTQALEGFAEQKKATGFGRDFVVKVQAADGTEVQAVASRQKGNWRRADSVVVRFKLGGKVASKPAVAAALAGVEARDYETWNPVLRSEFEAQAPGMADEWVAMVRRQWDYLVQQSDSEAIPSYLPYGDKRSRLLNQLREHGVTAPGPAKGTVVLSESLLTERAKEYAEAAALDWFYKTNAKLGELEQAEVVGNRGGDVIVKGIRQGRVVHMEQQRIIKSSTKGKLFHQFPARIYVDGKFTPELDYAKLMGDTLKALLLGVK